MDTKQLTLLITYHEDLVEQCKVHRRVSEQTLEELTVRALKELLWHPEDKIPERIG